jgi:hypothetical protein
MTFPFGIRSSRLHVCAALVAASSALSPAAASTGIPSYPGATSKPVSAGVHGVQDPCGHTITVVKSMNVDADPHAVANWYHGRLPGSRMIDASRELADGDDSDKSTTIQIFTADGSQSLIVSRTRYSAALAASAKTLGADKTDIGVESVSPPFSPSHLDLMAQVAAGGASAERAKRQMIAECKGG